ncbi:MAG: prolyl oligopeptidase family serine peptidase [Actinomycetota bacterium]|nr:prolyl oligopeptidase family serine peptidase [Actinomycetota bacterium]
MEPVERSPLASDFADRRWAQRRVEWDKLDWLDAESATSPALSPDGETLAYVSDRDGRPRLWLTHAGDGERRPEVVDTGADFVGAVGWSPDGAWLCVLTAPGGGEHTRVRALRPDGSGQRIIAGSAAGAAMLGPWQAGGHIVGVTETNMVDRSILDAYAVDVCTGYRRRLAAGHAATVCGFSHDGRYALVRVGRRGVRRILLVDSRAGATIELLGAPATVADARFGPDDRTIYLHTDADRDFAALLALPRVAAGHPDAAAVVAARPDAELERFALEPTGRAATCVWNVDGHAELEQVQLGANLPDTSSQPLPVPAEVITQCVYTHDGNSLLLGVQSVTEPPRVLRYPLAAGRPAAEPVRLAPASPPPWPPDAPVHPELHRFPAEDGLELTGWLYRPAGVTLAPTLIWLHGGPEAQERPVFNPLYQALLEQGIAVFAPNVRGSTGFGRRFVEADDHARRFVVVRDVATAVHHLVGAGLAAPERLACAGHSYGGYLTVTALVEYPELFRVGVNVCGIADFQTFFAHTEPWIAAAATSEYGDPRRDWALLRALSPIHRLERLVAPLLVVHGAQDTNVPLAQAEQLVATLRELGASPSYLLFPDEGHEVRGSENRAVFVREVVRWLRLHLLDASERSA